MSAAWWLSGAYLVGLWIWGEPYSEVLGVWTVWSLFWIPAWRFFFPFVGAFVFVAIAYHAQWYGARVFQGTVHVREPHAFDLRFFGVMTPNGLVTPSEWWSAHANGVLDVMACAAYLLFIFIFVIQLLAWEGRENKRQPNRKSLAPLTSSALLAFVWVNLAGYATYCAYPAAPPWYAARYGLGPAHAVAASAAGCCRVDKLLHLAFFQSLYGRARDVFGAVPSLHVAYPFIGFFASACHRHCVGLSFFFYLWMCFSALYLSHHYVFDVLWGSAYAYAFCFALFPGRDTSGCR